MTTQQTSFALPYRLEWHRESGASKPEMFIKTGTGQDAGYTVKHFDSREERAAFVANHPAARMPCWGRIERGEV